MVTGTAEAKTFKKTRACFHTMDHGFANKSTVTTPNPPCSRAQPFFCSPTHHPQDSVPLMSEAVES